MTAIWTPQWTGDGSADKTRCRASVECGTARYIQCSRKAKVKRTLKGRSYGFCAQHDPQEVQRRKALREARWDRELAVSNHQNDGRRLATEARDAIAKLDKPAAIKTGLFSVWTKIQKWVAHDPS